MKNLLKFTAVLLIVAGVFACSENVSVKSPTIEIPSWSNVIAYMTLLNKQKCVENITVFGEEYTLAAAGKTESPITGTWKLLLDITVEDTISYSCDNIFYVFGADSIVTVSTDVNAIKSGTFKYDYYVDPYCPLCDPWNAPPNLVIGNEEHYCQVARSWMIVYAVEHCDMGNIKIRRGNAEKILYRIK